MTMTISSTPGSDDHVDLDLARMRRERLAKLQVGMTQDGLDALVLAGNGNVSYATGARGMTSEIGRAVHEPVVAVVLRDGPPHVFTPYPEGAPSGLPPEHVHPPLLVEFPDGVKALAGALTDLLGGRELNVGFDMMSAAAHELLPRLLPGLVVNDAEQTLGPAKLVKTDDELECIRRAQRINELAMYDVYGALEPGVRQSDLSGIFLRRIFELGASANSIDPIWQATPAAIADGPFTVNGDVAFPTCSSDRILRQDDLVLVDSGLLYEGYASDFGRTWLAGGRLPTSQQRDHFKRWHDVIGRRARDHPPGHDRPRAESRPRARTSTDGAPGSTTSTWSTASAPRAPRCRSSGRTSVRSSTRALWPAGDGDGAGAGHLGGRRRRLPVGGHRRRHRRRIPVVEQLPLPALRRRSLVVVSLGALALDDGTRFDSSRLRRERRQRVLDAMEESDIDVLVVGREPNARYISGARRLFVAGTRPFAPGCVLVRASGDVPLMSTWDDGVPEEIPHDHLYGMSWNPMNLVAAIGNIEGVDGARRIGVDSMTPLFAQLFPIAAPDAELVDAESLLRGCEPGRPPTRSSASVPRWPSRRQPSPPRPTHYARGFGNGSCSACSTPA